MKKTYTIEELAIEFENQRKQGCGYIPQGWVHCIDPPPLEISQNRKGWRRIKQAYYRKRRFLCPICKKRVAYLQTYHISYEPEIKIKACRRCNFIEYLLRTDKVGRMTKSQKRIARRIIKGAFTYKFQHKGRIYDVHFKKKRR
jgi:hypothetical protein